MFPKLYFLIFCTKKLEHILKRNYVEFVLYEKLHSQILKYYLDSFSQIKSLTNLVQSLLKI